MRRRMARRATLAVMLAVGSVTAARADVIADWNAYAAGQAAGPAPTQFVLARAVTIMQIAMFDAVNGITPRYAPYIRSLPPAPAGASAEAAAAGAAHHVLLRLYPAQQAAIDAKLAASVLGIAEPGRSLGMAFGIAVADALCDLRESDKFLDPAPLFTSTGEPGDYEPTSVGQQPINRNAGNWVPFAMVSASQFRPNGPPKLTSPAYARDIAEVAAVGALDSLTRTDEQAMIARWHAELVPFQMNRVARDEMATDGRDLLEHARLMALLNIALGDAIVSVFEAKYVFRFWRPMTAIHRAADDGNARTEPVADWAPYLTTPLHPEYPSGHAVMHGAASRVLTAYFGPRHGFDASSPFVPGLVRWFDSFEAFVDDGANARVYGGIHFRTAVVEGARQGHRVGNWVVDTMLAPLQ